MKLIADNRKARFDYHILDKFEAGLVLTGSEVKAIRTGQVALKDAFVIMKNNEAFLIGVHISPYMASSYNNHEPERPRKLLLNREEIHKIDGKMSEKGFSCVPLKLYFRKGYVKAEIALVKGKNVSDKRNTVKDRDSKKQISAALKRGR